MDKQRLRAEVRRRRASLTPERRTAAERAAADHLLALPEAASARRILLYASHGDELTTDRVLPALVARGVNVLLPRVTGEDLEVVAVDTMERLAPGFQGVREPTGEATDPRRLDIAVVPGVAFDRRGGRLGQGGGHYDRLLRALPTATLRIGLCFATQLVDELPRESHDEPVDVIVTEEGVNRVAAR